MPKKSCQLKMWKGWPVQQKEPVQQKRPAESALEESSLVSLNVSDLESSNSKYMNSVNIKESNKYFLLKLQAM